MCSRVDVQTHAGRLGLGLRFDLRPFDVSVSVHAEILDYLWLSVYLSFSARYHKKRYN